MNTCGSNIPYILTANHALFNDFKVERNDWTFRFKFWSACDENIASQDIHYSGAELIAHNAATDFALVKLKVTPDANSGLSYAGWTRQTTGILNTTILHHPQGDLMKISKDYEGPVADHFQSNPQYAQCWRLDLNLGATQEGSSGAPYFDQNNRVFAQHMGEDPSQNANLCLRTKKWGGRFDLSWFGGGTNATGLSHWLDPAGTSAMTTNSTDISALLAVPTISGPDTICTEGIYTLGNLPSGVTATWSGSSQVTITPQNANGSIVKIANVNASGAITVTVTISGGSSVCGMPNALSKQIVIGMPGYSTLSGSYTTDGFSTPIEGQDQFCLKTYMFPGFYSGVISVNDQVAPSYTWTLISTSHPTNNPVTTGIGPVPGSSTDFNVYVKPQNGRATYRLTTSNNCGSYTRDYTFVADGICFITEAMVSPASVTIFPNPVEGLFTVSFADTDKVKAIKEISIHNRHGKELKRIKFANSKSEQIMNITDLPAEIYIVRVFDGNKWVSARIIKK